MRSPAENQFTVLPCWVVNVNISRIFTALKSTLGEIPPLHFNIDKANPLLKLFGYFSTAISVWSITLSYAVMLLVVHLRIT